MIGAAPWWVRPGLDIEDGRLRIAGHDAEALAHEHGTPLFVYDLARFGENARRMQAALGATGVPYRLRFALKANPFPQRRRIPPVDELDPLPAPDRARGLPPALGSWSVPRHLIHRRIKARTFVLATQAIRTDLTRRQARTSWR